MWLLSHESVLQIRSKLAYLATWRSSSTLEAKDMTFVGEPFLFSFVEAGVICIQFAGLWQRNGVENQGRPLTFRVETTAIYLMETLSLSLLRGYPLVSHGKKAIRCLERFFGALIIFKSGQLLEQE